MVHGGRKEDTTEVTQHTQWVGETDQQAKPVAAQSTALMRTRDSFPDLSCVCVCVCVCVLLCRRRKFEKQPWKIPINISHSKILVNTSNRQ